MEYGARVRIEIRMGLFGSFMRELAKGVWKDDLMGLAAQCAYAFIFSMFPFLILLVSLAAFVPADTSGRVLPPELSSQMPAAVRQILEDRIDEVANAPKAGALTIALILAIWSATSGATTLVTAINRAHDVIEKRSFMRKRVDAFGLIVAGAVLLLLPALWGLIGGVAKNILENIGMAGLAVAVDWLRWPVILIGAFAWLTLLFAVAPEGQKRWRLVTPGAAVAAIGFLAANRAFSYYVENATDMSVTYGALGGFISLLLWLYVCSLVLLLGAEVNAVLQARADEKGPAGTKLKPERPREVAPDDLPSLGKPIRH